MGKAKVVLPEKYAAASKAAHEAVCSLHSLRTKAEFEAALRTTWTNYCIASGAVMMPAGRAAELAWDNNRRYAGDMLIRAACSLAYYNQEAEGRDV